MNGAIIFKKSLCLFVASNMGPATTIETFRASMDRTFRRQRYRPLTATQGTRKDTDGNNVT